MGSPVTHTRAFVQASVDGETWTELGNATVPFGQPTTFSVELDHPVPARFVRVVPDLHPQFQDFRADPALHHPEAMFLFSELTLDGRVVAG